MIPLVCHGHSRPIVNLSYSPITEDGYFLVSASKDANPMLRNGESGDWIGTFEGHKGAVWDVSIDASALRTATASADFSAKVWNALTGDELHSFTHKHIVKSCEFSSDSKKLVTGGNEKILRVFNIEEPEKDPIIIEGSPGSIKAAMWLNYDRHLLTTTGEDPNLRLWDLSTNTCVRTIPVAAPISSMEVTNLGQGNMITIAGGNYVEFLNLSRLDSTKKIKFNFTVETASLWQPTNRLVVGGEDMWARLIDFNTEEELACNKGHHGPIHCVRFAPTGESYASGSEDGTIRIWQVVHKEGNGDVAQPQKSILG